MVDLGSVCVHRPSRRLLRSAMRRRSERDEEKDREGEGGRDLEEGRDCVRSLGQRGVGWGEEGRGKGGGKGEGEAG